MWSLALCQAQFVFENLCLLEIIKERISEGNNLQLSCLEAALLDLMGLLGRKELEVVRSPRSDQ